MQTNIPEIYTHYIASIIISILLIGSIIAILLLYQGKKRLQAIEVQNLKTKFDKELLQTRLEIQEDVLKKISMELHDNIGQIMLLTNVNLSILQTIPLEKTSSELIIDTKKLISKATEDLSQLSRSMNSDRITQIGVFAAIRHELGLMERKGLFEILFTNESADDGSGIPGETQLLVFRMFQEIFNNIIKHAFATLVTVVVEYQDDSSFCLRIADNGNGFEIIPGENKEKGYNGVGLRSLQSRARLFGGKLEISSILQQGTTITISIPLADDPSGAS